MNLQHGVTTSVRIDSSPRMKFHISFNGRPLWKPVVSRDVIQRYVSAAHKPFRVTVSHRSTLPMGCGYGTSGAGALSLSLALNDVLGSSLSRAEAAQIAHRAEVRHKTGLGTVTSAYYGGLVIRTRPGAPGYARIVRIRPQSSLRVVSGAFGPIRTASILSNVGLKRKINRCARGLVALQSQNPQACAFLGLSRRFADCLGILTPRLRDAIARMQQRRILSSMTMIGESIFTVVQEDLVPEAKMALKSVGLAPVVSKIEERGAKVL